MLEATFQVIVLRPYHANVGKRLVKTPKVYFTDTGMLCCLAPHSQQKSPAAFGVAKIAHLGLLRQGHPERDQMVAKAR